MIMDTDSSSYGCLDEPKVVLSQKFAIVDPVAGWGFIFDGSNPVTIGATDEATQFDSLDDAAWAIHEHMDQFSHCDIKIIPASEL
jgi:hypothetical protein